MPKSVRPPPGRPAASDERLARAALALQMQQPQEAEKLAESVLRGDRGHAGAATLLGHALIMQGRAAEALGPLERAARRSDDPALLTLLSAALAAAGREQDALDRIATVTATNVPFAPAYREHSARLAARGQNSDARALLERALAQMPEAAELSLDLAALHLRDHGRMAARQVLDAARNANPGRVDVLAELGRITLLDGEYATAADIYRHALALQPGDPMMRSNLAACQLEMGLRSEGEATLRAAMQGRPQMAGRAIHALCASSHGRFFLKRSAALTFLRGEKA